MKITATLLSCTIVSSFALVASSGFAEETGGDLASVNASQALPNAKPGECYAKVMIPAEYKNETQEVVKRDAYEQIEIIPARYEMVEEKVLVKQGGENIVPIPAVYETQEERIETEPARLVWRTGTDDKAKAADTSLVAGARALGLPETASAGQCFNEFYDEAQYKDEEQKVLIKEASKKYEIVPAKYETVEEKVLVSEASSKLVEVPAEYETVTEKVVQRAAYTTWKSGHGPVERLDNGTGEIMCLVQVPAQYTEVTKRVLKTPAATKKVEIPAQYTVQKVRKLVAPATQQESEIPAEYDTVTKRVKVSDAKTSWVLDGGTGDGKPTARTLCRVEVPAKFKVLKKDVIKTPATVKKIEIPAVYQTQKVRKLVSPPQEKRIKVPAEKETLTKRAKVSDAKLEWRRVLCETNMTKDLILQIQGALRKAGYDPGPVDGVVGRQTLVAVDQYQQKNDLPTGGLTMATLEKLGVAAP